MRRHSWLVLLAAVTACGGSARPGSTSGTGAGSSSAPSPSPSSPSGGTAQKSSGTDSVSVGATGYTFSYYVPTAPTPLPVVVAVHGTGGSAGSMAQAFSGLADKHGFAIVAPAYHDNGTYFTPEGDQAILSMIAALDRRATVDRKRIYTTGVSTGGTWSFIFGLQHSTEIAAASVIAGGYTGPDTTLVRLAARKIPFYLNHGVGDSIFPVSNTRAQHGALTQNGHPVRYDEHQGGHVMPADSPAQAWSFMAQHSL